MPDPTDPDRCADCGEPLDPARDGVCDDNVCRPCNERIEAEAEAHWASLSDEERTEIDRAAQRGAEKALEQFHAAIERRRRAESIFTEEGSRRIARQLHDRGTEITPSEVAEARDRGLAKIRAALTAKGYALPETEVGLMVMLQEIFKRGNEVADA